MCFEKALHAFTPLWQHGAISALPTLCGRKAISVASYLGERLLFTCVLMVVSAMVSQPFLEP